MVLMCVMGECRVGECVVDVGALSVCVLISSFVSVGEREREGESCHRVQWRGCVLNHKETGRERNFRI